MAAAAKTGPRARARAHVGRRAALAALAAAALACGGGEARSPNPTRPLDERRAIEIIRRAVKEDGESPAPAREVKLNPSGKFITVDVGVTGHEFGVAYITSDDAHALGDAILPPNKRDERLRIVRAGPTGETRIVLLYSDNYLVDDLAGDAHESTTIAVEGQITRDVQDFLVHAKAQHYQ